MGRLIYLEKKEHDDFKSFKFLADATELNEDRKAFNYIYYVFDVYNKTSKGDTRQ